MQCVSETQRINKMLRTDNCTAILSPIINSKNNNSDISIYPRKRNPK